MPTATRFPWRHRQPFAVVIFLGLLSFFLPCQARADGIDIPILLAAGGIVLVPLLAFEVFVEGAIVAWGLRVPYRQTLRIVLVANLVSLAAGVPVKIFDIWYDNAVLPTDLAPYFREFPHVFVGTTIIYFLVTLLMEYLIIRRWSRHLPALPCPRTSVFMTIFLANLATYAVLAPLNYTLTRPRHGIKEFTDTSTWAARQLTEIYYIESPREILCSILSDGTHRREIISDRVKAYQYYPNSDFYLYKNGVQELCLFQPRTGKRTVCAKGDGFFSMQQVAASPEGRWVAYLKTADNWAPCQLVLYDTRTGRIHETRIITDANTYNPEIAWTDTADLFFLKQNTQTNLYRLDPDGQVSIATMLEKPPALAVAYGRYDQIASDDNGIMKVYAERRLDSGIRVTQGTTVWYFADNPGWPKLGKRVFDNVCILQNGREVVFDDLKSLYLFDTEKKRVGKIVDGTNFMILTDRFLREKAWRRQW